MLPKQKRVRSSEFPEYAKKSTAYHLPYATLRVHKPSVSEKQKPASAAIVISNKVLKKSVDRNKLRRRAYGLLEEYMSGVPAGYSLLIYIKKEGAQLPRSDFRDALRALLAKAGFIPQT